MASNNLSNLARARGTVSLDEIAEETGAGFEPADTLPNPEQALIQKEFDEQLSQALACLSPRERLMVQFRYEEGMLVKEIAEMLRLHHPNRTQLHACAERQKKRICFSCYFG